MTVKMPIDPRTMPDGVVLILYVHYVPEEPRLAPSKTYAHAALKQGGFWYLTGSRAPQIAGWGGVERWLERDNRELVRVEIQTGTRTIWPEPVEIAVAARDETIHDDGGPCRYVAGFCNLCGAGQVDTSPA